MGEARGGYAYYGDGFNGDRRGSGLGVDAIATAVDTYAMGVLQFYQSMLDGYYGDGAMD